MYNLYINMFTTCSMLFTEENIHEYGLRLGQESPYSYCADTAHKHCTSPFKYRASPRKSVVIPCTYTDFHGITMDLCELLQHAYSVCMVQIWTLLTLSKSVFMDIFPCGWLYLTSTCSVWSSIIYCLFLHICRMEKQHLNMLLREVTVKLSVF